MQKYDNVNNINRDRHQQLLNVQREAEELFVKKNTDYDDDMTIYGSVGVIVRIADKIKRLSKITKDEISLVNNELVRDTLFDLNNLSAMAIILLDEDEEIKDHYTGKMRNMMIKSAETSNKTLTQSFLDTIGDLKLKMDKTMNISKLYRSKSTSNLLGLIKENDESTQNIEDLPKEFDEEGREIEVKYDDNDNIIHHLN